MQGWIVREVQTACFGDERLDQRFAVLLDRFSEKPSLSIPAACKGLAEITSAYRFFDNDRVDADKVLQPHEDATLQRIGHQEVVIIAQDTTEIELTRKEETVGGPLNDESRWGLFDHVQLAMTPERVPLGVVGAEIWCRDPEEFPKKRPERKNKPITEKESYRWLKGYRHACAIAEHVPQTTVVSVSDSEGDIYECFVEPAQREGKKAEWIVRACQDRAVVEQTMRLFETLSCRGSLGTLMIRVSKREATTGDGRKRKQGRQARKAEVTVRAARVQLRAPSRKGMKLPPVYVNVVLVREEKPPSNEEPIEWLLLTSLPIEMFEEVCEVIEYYCCRWEIESYFRVLKSGCKVEELQLESEDRFKPCLALYMIVAWRVLFLLMLGRKCPEIRCDAVLCEDEWKSVYVIMSNKPAPSEPPSLGTIVKMIAALGGYVGRKHDGPPGPQTMWIGLQRMRDFAMAWESFGPRPKRRKVV